MDLLSKLKDFNSHAVSHMKDLDSMCRESPFERARNEVTNQLQKSEQYRVAILVNVGIFQNLPHENLFAIAQCLEELHYVKGDIIIQQDDIGDSFFILEKGQAVVTVRPVSFNRVAKFV